MAYIKNVRALQLNYKTILLIVSVSNIVYVLKNRGFALLIVCLSAYQCVCLRLWCTPIIC